MPDQFHDRWKFSRQGYPVPKGHLERLPAELLHIVCALLAPPDAERKDIASFSLVSKNCAEAASRRRLERITITIGTTRKLCQDVGELKNILDRSARLVCVRQIKLSDHPAPMTEHRSQLVLRDRQTIEDEDSEVDDEDNHNICRLPRFRRGVNSPHRDDETNVFSGNSNQRESSPDEIMEMSRRFGPLSGLIGMLCGLTDLVWDCDCHVPLCLLNTLKQRCPRARLHVHRFHLREGCLPGSVIPRGEANADEYALVTSPSMDTIVWKRWGGRNHGRLNDALWCMLRGAAPNLKHVVLNWCGEAEHSYRCSQTPNFDATNHKAKLETLSVDAVRRRELLYWATVVDFRELRTLRLRGYMDQRDAFALRDIIEEQTTVNLRVLELHTDGGIWGEAGVAVSQIFTRVPPLQHIDFTGVLDSQQMPSILKWHGPTLKILELKLPSRERLNTQLLQGLKEIHEIEQRCPLLEKIELAIERTHGDRREAGIYESLGRMSRLRHVKLRLDCSMQTLSPKLGEPVVGEGYRGTHLSMNDYHKALTNTAIDGALVHAVFHRFGHQLEYLRIKPRGHGKLGRGWYDEQAMELLDWVGRDWVVRRSLRGEVTVSRGGCIREGPTGGGPWRGESLLRADFGRGPDFDDDVREDLREVWTSVWPGRDGDRAEQWSSVALAGSSLQHA